MSQAGRLGALLRRWLFALCLCVLLAILIVLWLGRGGDESHPLLLAIVGVGVVGAALCYSITTRVVAPTRLIVTRQAGWITPSKDYSWLVPFGAYVHDAVTLRAVHRRSRFRFLSSLVDVQIVGATLPGHQGGMAVALRAGKSRTDTVSTRCLRRGLFSLGAIDVSLSDVFGIVRQQD